MVSKIVQKGLFSKKKLSTYKYLWIQLSKANQNSYMNEVESFETEHYSVAFIWMVTHSGVTQQCNKQNHIQ